MVSAQGGDSAAVYDPTLLPTAPVQRSVKAPRAGFITAMDARGIGLVSMHLGGGRAAKGDAVDLAVGVVLNKKVGDPVAAGESLGAVFARTEAAAAEAAELLTRCFELSDERTDRAPFIKGVVR